MTNEQQNDKLEKLPYQQEEDRHDSKETKFTLKPLCEETTKPKQSWDDDPDDDGGGDHDCDSEWGDKYGEEGNGEEEEPENMKRRQIRARHQSKGVRANRSRESTQSFGHRIPICWCTPIHHHRSISPPDTQTKADASVASQLDPNAAAVFAKPPFVKQSSSTQHHVRTSTGTGAMDLERWSQRPQTRQMEHSI